MPVNQAFALKANEVYAKGGFVPRPKGARYMHLYTLFPDFASQQGEVSEFSQAGALGISRVEFLGLFPGYTHHGTECEYRAFKVTMSDGSVLAGYSHDDDRYNLCVHVGYIHR
jgi:hypothetical protein